MLDILNIQLKDNVKARVLNNDQDNQYIDVKGKKKTRSQLEIYKYLQQKSPTS